MRSLAPVVALALLAAVVLPAASPPPLRAHRFAVASPERLASEAGAEMLRQGGTAADAAVATALVLGVVTPWSCGIGGGGFALVWKAEDRSATFLDFRETAPAAATADMFLRDGRPDPNLSRRGALAVAVPGEVAGLAELSRRFGRLGLARAAAPAIRLAEQGFPARRRGLEALGARPVTDPAIARIFSPGGALVTAGTTLRNLPLARTLRAIARGGPEAFYRGAVARAIAAAVRAGGGILTEADLAAYRVRERAPLRGRYRGRELLTAPPPSSGGVVLLEALALLEPHDLRRLGAGSSAHLHLVAEALKAAFADRAIHLGDPDHSSVPVERLLEPSRLRERAARLRLDRALPASAWATAPQAPDDHGTSHLSVVDAEGNAVALTTTVNLEFGAELTAGDTGVVLNDEMDDFAAAVGNPNAFDLVQSVANAVGPGKRPLSSMSPTIVVGPDGPQLVTGSAGGPRISSSTLQVILGVVDFGLDASAALGLPRIHHQWLPDVLRLEHEVPADVCRALRARGHAVERMEAVGRAHAVVVRREGGRRWLEAASDPRTEGAPAGE